MKIYQIIWTANDANGNPRRLTCVYAGPGDPRESCLLEVIEHGYGGDHIPPGAFVLPGFDVVPSEYRAVKGYAKTHLIYTNN